MPMRTRLPYLTRRMLLAATAATVFTAPALAQDTLKLGLVAAMSGLKPRSASARAAESVLIANFALQVSRPLTPCVETTVGQNGPRGRR